MTTTGAGARVVAGVFAVAAALSGCAANQEVTVSAGHRPSPAVSPSDPVFTPLPAPKPSVPPPTTLPGTGPSASTPAGTTASGAPAEQRAHVTAAAREEAQRRGVAPSEVTLVRWEEVVWPDASLGCPQPGHQYATALVPGERAVFVTSGVEAAYHGRRGGPLTYCATPGPALPTTADPRT